MGIRVSSNELFIARNVDLWVRARSFNLPFEKPSIGDQFGQKPFGLYLSDLQFTDVGQEYLLRNCAFVRDQCHKIFGLLAGLASPLHFLDESITPIDASIVIMSEVPDVFLFS